MTMTKTNTAKMAFFGAAVALAPFAAGAAELRYASVAPPDSPWANIIGALISNASTNSNGEIVITPFLGGQLGSEPDVIQQVARGRVDMGGFSSTAVALVVPELGLLNAPYLWDSIGQAECALDNHLITALEPYFAARGLVNLGWGETGYQEIFSAEPMLTAADFDGARIRVSPAEGSVLGFQATGTNGVVLPASDTNGAVQTGLVSGAEMNVVFGVLTGLGQLAPHLNMTNHVYLPSLSVMSLRSFEELTEEQQQVILHASAPPAVQRGTVRAVIGALTQRFVDAGGTVHELDPAEIQLLRDAMIPTYPALVETIGGDAQAVWDEILAAKAACPA